MTAELGIRPAAHLGLFEERGPQSAPEAVLTAALAEVGKTAQRRPIVRALDRRSWPPHHLGPKVVAPLVASRGGRLLILALIAAALVALVLAGIGALRPPVVTATASTFILPFEYSLPADSTIRPSPNQVRDLVAWVDDPDRSFDPLPENPALNLGSQPNSSDARGLIVGYGEEAWSHGP